MIISEVLQGAKQRTGNSGSGKNSKFKSSCWRNLFSFFTSYFRYHKRLESWKGLQTLKHQTPSTIEQYHVLFARH